MGSHSQTVFAEILHLIGVRAGLSFGNRSLAVVEAEVQKAMVRARCADLAEYLRLLETRPGALDDLLVELTVGETYFFREYQQFEFIDREVLPDVFDRLGGRATIRAWSAGCASGEEPYSLAMLLDERGWLERARILATDISRRSLEKARRGAYRAWSLRGAGAERARPYLQLRDGVYELPEALRRRVRFEYLNLALDCYPSMASGTHEIDLILCRNVFIYFDPQTVRNVAARLLRALRPGGWLITGAADPSLSGTEFRPVVTAHGVYYQRPERGVGRPGGAGLVSPGPAETQLEETAGVSTAPEVVAVSSASIAAGRAAAAELQLEQARQALREGQYGKAVELAAAHTDRAEACRIHILALANLDGAAAQRVCQDALVRHPLSAQLHHLQALLLMQANRPDEAAQAARRVVYLDPALAVGHFTLGAILRALGDPQGARRAFRCVVRLCARRGADELLPLADGERAGSLLRGAQQQLDSLDTLPASDA